MFRGAFRGSAFLVLSLLMAPKIGCDSINPCGLVICGDRFVIRSLSCFWQLPPLFYSIHATFRKQSFSHNIDCFSDEYRYYTVCEELFSSQKCALKWPNIQMCTFSDVRLLYLPEILIKVFARTFFKLSILGLIFMTNSSMQQS